MAGTHMKAAINKITKPELIQLLLNNIVKMGAQISTTLTAEVKELNNYLKSWRQTWRE